METYLILYQVFPSKASFVKKPSYPIADTAYNKTVGSVNRKYQTHQIYEMAQLADYQEKLLFKLENRKTKKARKASYVAMKEYRAIRSDALEPATYSKQQNDLIIVRTLRDFGFKEKYSHTVS